jgi:hypothetical protein
MPAGSIAGASAPELPKSVQEFFGSYLDSAGKLGEGTAALETFGVAGRRKHGPLVPLRRSCGASPAFEKSSPPPKRCQMLDAWSHFWRRWVSIVYYQSYCSAAGHAAFLPGSASVRQILLDACLLRKAIYELGAELNQRPDWVAIPLEGIIELINSPAVIGKSK